VAVIGVGDRATAGLPRLVVLRALGLGDLLTAVPALRALRDRYPRHERVLAAPAFLAPLVGLLDGTIDAVVDVDFRKAVDSLPPSLSAADVAVNLHGRGPESHLALRALRAPRLLAFHHAEDAPAGPRWDGDEHERVRWCRMLAAFGVPADPDDLLVRPPAEPIPDEYADATVIHPGAAAPARRWPIARWAAVARSELRNGRTVIITGGRDETDLAMAAAAEAGIGERWVVAGRTDLTELTALVAAAGRVACGDTGVAHLATAVATPSVVLFGPTSPAQWGPPATPHHVALWAGRTGDPHGDRPDDGLLAIDVADVTAALDALPAGRRWARTSR
jgi:ADP-heptose:LPS heptosyltransferase